MSELNYKANEFTNELALKQSIYDAAINQGYLRTILKKQAEILHFMKDSDETSDELFSKFESEALIEGHNIHDNLPEDWKA